MKHGTLSTEGSDILTPKQRSPGEKLQLLLESQKLSGEAKGEWLRQQGLHSEHVTLWEQELKKQEKALAEPAILISLKKIGRVNRSHEVVPQFVHADNGHPMRGVTLGVFLERLHVTRSYSRKTGINYVDRFRFDSTEIFS